MLVSQIKEEDLTLEVIDRLLFQGIEDTGENADCVIVLGSIKAAKYRVPVAVEAYNAGRSNKLMLCGGKLRDFPDGKYSEAEHGLYFMDIQEGEFYDHINDKKVGEFKDREHVANTLASSWSCGNTEFLWYDSEVKLYMTAEEIQAVLDAFAE